MQLGSHPPISVPAPIVIPSAPILPEHRLVFGSSNHDDQPRDNSGLEEPPGKKRKKDRACDYCRRRKIKCDGPWRQGQVCTNCIHGHRRCTYVESSKPRGPPKAYVTALEDRIERLEELIKQLRPNDNFSEELGPPIVRGSWKDEKPDPSSRSSKSSTLRKTSETSSLSTLNKPKTVVAPPSHDFPMSQVDRTTHLIFHPPLDTSNPSAIRKNSPPKSSILDSSSEESANDSEEETVETGMGGRHKYGLSAMEDDDDLNDSRIRFHGRSSTAGLVEVTRKFKHMCMQERSSQEESEAQGRGTSSSTGGTRRKNAVVKADNADLRVYRRHEFWSTAKWEEDWNSLNIHSTKLIPELLTYFPPDPVAAELIELYFCHSNPYLPLLHRPTFERYWRERLHHTNVWFATLCVLIFAVASRWYENGGEALQDWLQGGDQWKAVGWKWFFVALDVHCVRRSLSCPATLIEIQTFALMVLFLRGTTCLAMGWLFVSIGIRKAQDRGAHRRTVYKSYPNADDELWKRAFWVLLAFDHILGASLGRGITTGQEDYDLDLPLEIDDEYWDTGDPETDFKQPSDVPSKISVFTHYLRLSEIIAFTAKTLYPVDKRKVFLGFVKGDWTGEVVRQLRMAMEDWVNKIPPHLKWDKATPDSVFSRQAASIHALYHCVMMTTWRPFCAYNSTAPTRPDDDRQSIAMSQCAKSIKACAGILDIEMQRGLSNAPNMINVSLVCAGTLAILLWVLQRKMVASGQGKTQIRNFEVEQTGIFISDLLDAVDICMNVLTLKQGSWECAEALVEQLKAALPSDRDKSFESLDIPMPSVHGISDVMRVPGHLDDTKFRLPPDAAFSFTDSNYYDQMMDHLNSYNPTGMTLETHPNLSPSSIPYSNSSGLNHTGPMVSLLPNPPPTSFSDASLSPPEYPILSRNAQPPSLDVSHYPQPLRNGFGTQTFPDMARPPLKPHFHSPDQHSYPISEFTGHRAKASVVARNSKGTVSEFSRLGGESESGSLFDSEPGFNGSPNRAEDRRYVRTRTSSLVDQPFVPTDASSTDGFLRRTSFPNLQAVKSVSYPSPLGSLSNRSVPNVGVIDQSEEFEDPHPPASGTRRRTSLTQDTSPASWAAPSQLMIRSINHSPAAKTKPTRTANSFPPRAGYERDEPRLSQGSESRSWVYHSLPTPTSPQRYTRQRFIQETPSER